MIKILTFQDAIDIVVNKNKGLYFFFKSEKYYPIINEFTIFRLAKILNSSIKWMPVPFWSEVESGSYDDIDSFLKILIKESPDYKGDYIFYTMGSYSTKKVFSVSADSILDFSINYRIYLGQSSTFIGPLDYIVFSEEKNTFTLLYHEGKFVEIELGSVDRWSSAK